MRHDKGVEFQGLGHQYGTGSEIKGGTKNGSQMSTLGDGVDGNATSQGKTYKSDKEEGQERQVI